MSYSYRIIASVLLAIAFTATAATAQGRQKKTPAKPMKQLSYKKEIAPIMKTYCLPCHTEDAMNPSRLYLDSYESMMAGGKHGPAVTAAKPDSSLLVRKISFTPPFGDPMPMKRKSAFPNDTLDLLRQWITQGAKNN
jgi:hypothetical protein